MKTVTIDTHTALVVLPVCSSFYNEGIGEAQPPMHQWGYWHTHTHTHTLLFKFCERNKASLLLMENTAEPLCPNKNTDQYKPVQTTTDQQYRNYGPDQCGHNYRPVT